MRIPNKAPVATLAVAFAFALAGLFFSPPATRAAQPTVDLKTAAPFAILAGTPAITDNGASVITGNVGLSPKAGSGITGLLCAQVTGSIFAIDATGLPCFTNNGPLLVIAKNDLTAAYLDAASRIPVTTVGTELGGTTKTAGTYISGATNFQITNVGPLVLDGQGDSSSVFIFNAPLSAPGLTVGPGSTVSLINGAQACNVFWRVDSAAINTTAVFKGTILALNDITVANGANIEGRLLARNGQVTLINDVIKGSVCAASINAAVTPKFPNTGVAPTSSNTLLGLGALGGLITISILLAVARRKHII